MASIRTLIIHLATFSSALAVPMDHGEQNPESASLKNPSDSGGSPSDDWSRALEIQAGDIFDVLRQQCVEKSVSKFNIEYDPSKMSNSDPKVVACTRFASQAIFDLAGMNDEEAEGLFLEANPGVESPFKHHDKSHEDDDAVHSRSTQSDDDMKKAKKRARKECKERVEISYQCKGPQTTFDRKKCRENARNEYKECMIQVAETFSHLHRRQLFPGSSAVDEELLKDAGKAGIWFAEHCAPEMVLAKIEGRKPHYDGLREKFMCPAIAMTFRHLVPFANPFDAMMMPGPVIEEQNVTEPADETLEA